MNTALDTLKRLEDWFADCPFAIVAFSGGVDSSLVCFVANRSLGPKGNLAVISDSASLKRSELRGATNFCRRNRIPMRIIRGSELENRNYASNPANRCFYCKRVLYQALRALAAKYPGSWVLNGTNLDDHGDYRPGLQAARELGVRAPLAECGLDKHAVRSLAAELELNCWDKPASPCLSSRIAYGLPVTAVKLRRIEQAEAILTGAGFPIVRVRHLEREGRIEVPVEEVARLQSCYRDLEPQLLQLGFQRVTIDPEGFVSGKLNRSLATSERGLPIVTN